jgi:hypothetical protein
MSQSTSVLDLFIDNISLEHFFGTEAAHKRDDAHTNKPVAEVQALPGYYRSAVRLSVSQGLESATISRKAQQFAQFKRIVDRFDGALPGYTLAKRAVKPYAIKGTDRMATTATVLVEPGQSVDDAFRVEGFVLPQTAAAPAVSIGGPKAAVEAGG